MSDPTQVLTDIFLGPVEGATGAAAFDGLFEGTVVSSTSTEVVITVNGFDPSGKSSYTCKYEKRPGASPATPPKGTTCLVAFPGSVAASGKNPATVGTPWVVAFTGWP